jgi:hypothetical protein
VSGLTETVEERLENEGTRTRLRAARETLDRILARPPRPRRAASRMSTSVSGSPGAFPADGASSASPGMGIVG